MRRIFSVFILPLFLVSSAISAPKISKPNTKLPLANPPLSQLTISQQDAVNQLDSLTQEFLANYYASNGLAAMDLGFRGTEKKYFGPFVISAKETPFTARWTNWSIQGLKRRKAFADSFRVTLATLRPYVRYMDDKRKAEYNMMVGRTNLTELWLHDDLRYQLPLVCASTLSGMFGGTLFSLNNSPNDPVVKREAGLRLNSVPSYLKGCIESIEAARSAGRSLSTQLLKVAGGTASETLGTKEEPGQVDKIAAKVPGISKDVKKSIEAFAAKADEWSKDCLSCETIMGKNAFEGRWFFGLGRPENPLAVSDRAKKEMEQSSQTLKEGVRKLFSKLTTSTGSANNDIEKMREIRNAGTPATIEEALASYQKKTDRDVSITRSLFDLPANLHITAAMAPPDLKGFGAAYKPSSIYGSEGSTGLFYVDDSRGLGFHHQLAQSFVTAHEAAPGHGLQMAMFQRLRDQINPIFFLDGTSDNLMGEYYGHENAEGWGYFAEFFANEYFPNFYSEDEKVLLEQSRTWRTARAYIEPRIQSGLMTFDDAKKILMEQVLLDEGSATGQAMSFLLVPGQRASYYVGAEKIRSLEAQIAQILGKDKLSESDLREFHTLYFSYGLAPISFFDEAILNRYRAKKGLPLKEVPLLKIYSPS